MCGRYVNAAKKEQVRKEFRALVSNTATDKLRYNIAPAQMINVVLESEKERIISQLKWGLVPKLKANPILPTMLLVIFR